MKKKSLNFDVEDQIIYNMLVCKVKVRAQTRSLNLFVKTAR